jgi:hypothetical protein
MICDPDRDDFVLQERLRLLAPPGAGERMSSPAERHDADDARSTSTWSSSLTMRIAERIRRLQTRVRRGRPGPSRRDPTR